MLQKLLPPKNWQLPVMFITCIFKGLILFVLYVSKAHSYLLDKPETCTNCHIMALQFATWNHSSHYKVVYCNDSQMNQLRL